MPKLARLNAPGVLYHIMIRVIGCRKIFVNNLLLTFQRSWEVNDKYGNIMRAFVRLSRMLSVHKDLEHKLTTLEQKYDEQFKLVFDAIRALMAPPEKPPEKIYPVKSMSPPPAGVHYQDGSTTLNLPRVVNSI